MNSNTNELNDFIGMKVLVNVSEVPVPFKGTIEATLGPLIILRRGDGRSIALRTDKIVAISEVSC